MDYRALGRSGLMVSQICLGTMNFGMPGWGCDRAESERIVKVFRDAGGNFFDTADVYGGGASEEILGSLLRAEREEVVIATKVGLPTGADPNARGTSAKHIHTAVEGSLRRLGVDYIDLYQVHHFDHQVPLEETMDALDRLVLAGKVRYIGCSNFYAWQIADAANLALQRDLSPFISAQMMFNLVRRDIEREHIDVTDRHGLGILAYGPLHAGLLAAGWATREEIPPNSRVAMVPEVYLADEERTFSVTRSLVEHAHRSGIQPGQLALAWVLRQKGITAALTAALTSRELEDQLCALTVEVDNSIWASLDGATRLPASYPQDFYERQAQRT
jgi:aryl-alcohol dehydrogenase-like predicted oxidoreductase